MAIYGRQRRAVAITLLVTCALARGARPALAAPEGRRACFAAYERVQVLMRRSHLREAREAASACLADGCPSALRADCGQWLKDVEARLPTVVVECRTADGKPVNDARILLDGLLWKARLDGIVSEVDPGEHVVRVERPSGPAAEVKVIVAEGKKAQRIVVEIPDEPVPDRVPPAVALSPTASPPPAITDVPPERAPVPASFYVSSAIGVAALGGFTFFAFQGKDAEHGLDACSPRCSDDAVADVRRHYITADVLLGVSAVALGIAAYVLLARGSASPPPAASSLR
jgi:hypothetical protein